MQKISPLVHHPDVVNNTSKLACGIINRAHLITSFAQYSAELVGYKRADDLLGRTTMDFRGASIELGYEYFQQDARVMLTGQDSDSINLFVSADGELHFLLTQKRAVFKPGSTEVIGCEAFCSELEPHQLTPFTRRLFDHKVQRNKGQSVFSVNLVDVYSDLALTSRESQVLFLLAYGYSAKQLGTELFLSCRTVECHINTLKAKLNIPNKSGLVEFALFSGLDTQLPRRLVSRLLGRKIHE